MDMPRVLGAWATRMKCQMALYKPGPQTDRGYHQTRLQHLVRVRSHLQLEASRRNLEEVRSSIQELQSREKELMEQVQSRSDKLQRLREEPLDPPKVAEARQAVLYTAQDCIAQILDESRAANGMVDLELVKSMLA